MSSLHLYCPGEDISGDLLLKNRFEAVVLRDDNVVNDHVFHKEILSTWTCDEFPDMPAGAWFIDFIEGKPGDGNRAAGAGHERLVRSF